VEEPGEPSFLAARLVIGFPNQHNTSRTRRNSLVIGLSMVKRLFRLISNKAQICAMKKKTAVKVYRVMLDCALLFVHALSRVFHETAAGFQNNMAVVLCLYYVPDGPQTIFLPFAMGGAGSVHGPQAARSGLAVTIPRDSKSNR
jgi:hypothetical protein